MIGRLLTRSLWCLLLVGAVTIPGNTWAYANTAPIADSYNNIIISDTAFTATGTMSAADVQNFLNSKVPTCDTWHANTVGGSEVPPWTCLKDYVDPKVNKKASQIIYEEAVNNGLNPQVILVTLQKENSLVTDSWPFASQYRTAMGYGCPETAGCETSYYGFYNQVHLGSMLLREGYDRACYNMSSYPGWGDIAYDRHLGRTANIDGRQTYIGSCSTGSLYNYTPHRPDSAWRTAASDGVYYYGNYNFVTRFLDWFPGAYGVEYGFPVVASLWLSNTSPVAGEQVSASYAIKNTTSGSITIDAGLADMNTNTGQWNSYTPQSGITLASGEQKVFNFTKTAQYSGPHRTWIAIGYNGTWYDAKPSVNQMTQYSYNVGNAGDVIKVSSSIYFSNVSPAAGETLTVSFGLKNVSGATVTSDVAVPDNNTDNGQWNSFTPQTGLVFAPGESKYLTFSKIVKAPGAHRTWIAASVNGTWYDAKALSTQMAQFSYGVRIPNIRMNYYYFDILPPRPNERFDAHLSLTNLEGTPIVVDAGVPIRNNITGAWNTMLYSAVGQTLTPNVPLNINMYQTLAPGGYTIWPSVCTVGYCINPKTSTGVEMFWAGWI